MLCLCNLWDLSLLFLLSHLLSIKHTILTSSFFFFLSLLVKIDHTSCTHYRGTFRFVPSNRSHESKRNVDRSTILLYSRNVTEYRPPCFPLHLLSFAPTYYRCTIVTLLLLLISSVCTKFDHPFSFIFSFFTLGSCPITSELNTEQNVQE